MSRFDVLFSREIRDAVFEGRNVSKAERFAQLVKELAEPALDMQLRATITHDGNIEIFLASLRHDGDGSALRAALQQLYDDNGVAGWFEIALPSAPRIVVTLSESHELEVYCDRDADVRLVDRGHFGFDNPRVIPYDGVLEDIEGGEIDPDDAPMGLVFDYDHEPDPGFVARVFDLEPSE